MLEAFEITAEQANAVRAALKILRLQHWKFTIGPHPLKKPKWRVVITPRGESNFEGNSGTEWNKIIGVLRNAKC